MKTADVGFCSLVDCEILAGLNVKKRKRSVKKKVNFNIYRKRHKKSVAEKKKNENGLAMNELSLDTMGFGWNITIEWPQNPTNSCELG